MYVAKYQNSNLSVGGETSETGYQIGHRTPRAGAFYILSNAAMQCTGQPVMVGQRCRNMSTKSPQGHDTPGSRDECRTAPDGRRPFGPSPRTWAIAHKHFLALGAAFYSEFQPLWCVYGVHGAASVIICCGGSVIWHLKKQAVAVI